MTMTLRERIAEYLRAQREAGEEWILTEQPVILRAAPPASARPAAPPTPRTTPSAPPAEPVYVRDNNVRIPKLGGSVPGSGPEGDPVVQGLWQLWEDCKDCPKCKLANGRSRVVVGVGNAHSPVMFIGEAPGADEDRLGEPFVGRAGQLLTETLQQLGRPRAEIYIANMIKCRPPDNRDPEPDEIAACRPWLQRQVDLIRPKCFIALGRVAAQNLLQSKLTLGTLRTQTHNFMDRPFHVTYHPAAILRNLNQLPLFVDDLKKYLAGA